MIRNYKFGVDMDCTLTDTPPLEFDGVSLDKLIECSKSFPAKKGIEFLSTMDLDITIITGRGESFRVATNDWLVRNGINFRELVMIGDYKDNKFDMDLYLKCKVDAYLSRGIHFALDDDKYVIDMLNLCGIKAVRVDGDFREAFNALFK